MDSLPAFLQLTGDGQVLMLIFFAMPLTFFKETTVQL
jgi:hypothetical protein